MHALLLIAALLAPPQPVGPGAVPGRLPHYEAQRLTGGPPVALRKAYKGQPLVVHLWATWCVPCLDELPTLEATLTPWMKAGGVVVNVSVDRARAKLDTFLNEQDITGTTLWDPTEEALHAFGLDQLPSTLIYDRAGKLLYVRAGPLDPTDPALKAALQGALAKRR